MTKMGQNWKDGPWDNEPDHEKWIDEETAYDLEIIRIDGMGHLCGYVYFPEGFVLSQRQRDALEFNVHGGITYSDKEKMGFDCAHHLDHTPCSPVMLPGHSYKDISFVREQTESLAVQLWQVVRSLPQYPIHEAEKEGADKICEMFGGKYWELTRAVSDRSWKKCFSIYDEDNGLIEPCFIGVSLHDCVRNASLHFMDKT